MEVLQAMKERYSVRDYDGKKIEDEKMEQLMHAVALAPTAKNLQPFHIYVLESEEALKKIRSITGCAYNAPVVFLFSANKEQEWKNPLEEGIVSGEQDCAIAATHLMLEAENLGLGTVYVCMFPNRKVEEAFALPENERAVLLMPCGYPSETSTPSANHSKSKSTEELFERI